MAQEPVTKNIPKKFNMAKWLSEEDSHIAEKRRETKGEGEKDTHLNAEFQRIARREKFS